MELPEPGENMAGITIRTTSKDWLGSLAKAYKSKTSVTLVDDAPLGVDPISMTLLEMGRQANLSAADWIAVSIGVGMSTVGAWLLVVAGLDPEPFSKLAAALGAGTLAMMGGGFAAIRVITGHKPPNVRVSPTGGFEIGFD
ncbi:MAG: hypothetical protein ACHQ53_15510 [Polyangiales bacterium]